MDTVTGSKTVTEIKNSKLLDESLLINIFT